MASSSNCDARKRRNKHDAKKRQKTQTQNKKIKDLQDIVNELEKKNYLEEYQLGLEEQEYEGLDDYREMCQTEQSANELYADCPEDLRTLALRMFFHSPEGYKYVVKTYQTALPPLNIVFDWWMTSNLEPGLTRKAFEMLKDKTAGKRIICSLVVEDIQLNGDIFEEDYKVQGQIDFGVGSLDEEKGARESFTLTLVCLEENWKIPLGYFLVSGIDGEFGAFIIMGCLRQLYYVGIDVVALTFDGYQNSIVKKLGCNMQNVRSLKTTFKHPECDSQIAIFTQLSILKFFTRCSLESAGVMTRNEDKIKREFLFNLMILQNTESLEFAKKLTPRQLELRHRIMKMNLTIQALNMNTAEALKLCDELLTSSLFQATESTVQFLTWYNHIFDLLSTTGRGDSPFKQPITKENSATILSFLENTKNYILSLKVPKKCARDEFRRVRANEISIFDAKHSDGYTYLLACVESLKHLITTVIQNGKLKYLFAGRLCSTYSPLYLASVKAMSESTTTHGLAFKQQYKKLFETLRLRPSIAGSCISVENLPLTPYASSIHNINFSSRTMLNPLYGDTFEDEDDLKKRDRKNKKRDAPILKNVKNLVKILNNDHLTDSIDPIIGYISGWISKEVVKVLKCDDCIDALMVNQQKHFHSLIPVKNACGIFLASESVFKICLKSEQVIRKFFKKGLNLWLSDGKSADYLKSQILCHFQESRYSDVFADMTEHSLEQPPMFNHRLQMIRTVIDKYVRVRQVGMPEPESKREFTRHLTVSEFKRAAGAAMACSIA